MSQRSEAVKRWRKNSKQRIIDAMGGKCCVCGYNKCQRALACHHLDPTKKDIGMGAVRANPTNWTKIVEELRKCVLLCHNCHCEVHEGLITLPEKLPKFDEFYADYKAFMQKTDEANKFSNKNLKNIPLILNDCPVCKKPKPPYQITCSTVCAAKHRNRIDWDDEWLLTQVNFRPITDIAESLGVSDGAVHKRLKRIKKVGINAPGKDYGGSFVVNCEECKKPVKRCKSVKAKLMFCSKTCHYSHYNINWPSNEELLSMKNTLTIDEICAKLKKSKSSVYDRFRKIKSQ